MSFLLRPGCESDLEEWGRVAALAFASRGGDPRRFLVNHRADGEAKAEDIHVRAPPPLAPALPSEPWPFMNAYRVAAGVQGRRDRGGGTGLNRLWVVLGL